MDWESQEEEMLKQDLKKIGLTTTANDAKLNKTKEEVERTRQLLKSQLYEKEEEMLKQDLKKIGLTTTANDAKLNKTKEEVERTRQLLKSQLNEKKPPTTAVAQKRRARQMRYKLEDDLMLLRQVLAENPYEDSARWKIILEALLHETGHKPFSLKNMRERVNLLLDHFEKKDVLEIYTSGVEPPPLSEKDQLLEQIKVLKSSFTRIKTVNTRPADIGHSIRDAAAMQHWSGESAETVPAGALEFEVIDQDFVEDGICQELCITPHQDVSTSATAEPSAPETSIPSELQSPQPTSSNSGQRNNSTSTRPSGSPGASLTPNNGGGPIRRRRAGINRSIVSYLKSKWEVEAELKLKTVELELLREQNESRRISVQEQQMALVISCHTKTIEALSSFLNKSADRPA